MNGRRLRFVAAATLFASLWHGTRLAYTVACATTLLAGAFWFASAAAEE